TTDPAATASKASATVSLRRREIESAIARLLFLPPFAPAEFDRLIRAATGEHFFETVRPGHTNRVEFVGVAQPEMGHGRAGRQVALRGVDESQSGLTVGDDDSDFRPERVAVQPRVHCPNLQPVTAVPGDVTEQSGLTADRRVQ